MWTREQTIRNTHKICVYTTRLERLRTFLAIAINVTMLDTRHIYIEISMALAGILIFFAPSFVCQTLPALAKNVSTWLQIR